MKAGSSLTTVAILLSLSAEVGCGQQMPRSPSENPDAIAESSGSGNVVEWHEIEAPEGGSGEITGIGFAADRTGWLLTAGPSARLYSRDERGTGWTLREILAEGEWTLRSTGIGLPLVLLGPDAETRVYLARSGEWATVYKGDASQIFTSATAVPLNGMQDGYGYGDLELLLGGEIMGQYNPEPLLIRLTPGARGWERLELDDRTGRVTALGIRAPDHEQDRAVFVAIGDRIGRVIPDSGAVVTAKPAGGGGRILRTLVFTDRDHGWAGGDAGELLFTYTGGEVWYGKALPTLETVYRIIVINETGWILTRDELRKEGTLWYFDASADQVQNAVPEKIELRGDPGLVDMAYDPQGVLWLAGPHGTLLARVVGR